MSLTLPELEAIRGFMRAEHEVDDEERVETEGDVPHEEMAGLTMEQISKGTGLGMQKLKTVMQTAEADEFIHAPHPVEPTRYALATHAHKFPDFRPGLDFGEE